MAGKRNNNKTFTDKQKELFPYIAENMSNRDMATTLGVSSSSINSRIAAIFDISGCLERDELMEYVKKHMEQEIQA